MKISNIFFGGGSGVCDRISTSFIVSKLCQDIDEHVGDFLNRRLTGELPYVWLDATYLKVRQGCWVVPVAVVIAVAVNIQ